MNKHQKPAKGYTIREVNGLFKVFDKDQKFRRNFSTRQEAETFGASLAARKHTPVAAVTLPLEA